MSKKQNEAHERAEYRQQQQHKKAIFEKVAAQRASDQYAKGPRSCASCGWHRKSVAAFDRKIAGAR